MKALDVLFGAAAVVVSATILAIFLYFFIGPAEENKGESAPEAKFSIIEIGRAGNYGYVVYDINGTGELKIVSYERRGFKDIIVINDSEGVEISRLPELVDRVKPIEKYGYTVEISNRRMLGKGIYIVATGGIPNYVLDDIKNNVTEGIVIYIGQKDLVLRSGRLVNENWYDSLDEAQKKRLLIYNKTTLGAYLEEENNTMITDVLENKWSYENAVTYNISGSGRGTRTILLNSSRFIRVIYDVGRYKGVVDSVELRAPRIVLHPIPESVFPWQTAELTYSLGRTNGTAYFIVAQNGVDVSSEMLKRVSEESVFIKRLNYRQPGDYILIVKDNDGVVASGILHVRELKIEYVGKSLNRYHFNVTVDNVPLKSAEVYASLNNSTEKKKFYISNGELAIGALLQKGENIFNIEIEGTTYHVPVTHAEESVWEIYIKYGIPGLSLVLVVYVVARLSKRPVYILRVPEGGREIRKEVRVRRDALMSAIEKIREDTKLRKYPITVSEFEIALKRYITNGADVSEGNVEEILRKLVYDGLLEQYNGYYQPVGEGRIKEKALLRTIREHLIANGIMFKEVGNKFTTKDFDIGLYGEKYDRKTIIVVENDDEIERIMNSLGERERVELRIKQANGLITFTKINRLGEIL
ncbi:MAG: hypothetical protein QXT05_01870 [Candidatus Bilamarchaeaceae archaeon]